RLYVMPATAAPSTPVIPVPASLRLPLAVAARMKPRPPALLPTYTTSTSARIHHPAVVKVLVTSERVAAARLIAAHLPRARRRMRRAHRRPLPRVRFRVR